MSNADQIQRFLFDDTHVRGVLVGLESSYQQVLERHNYPPVVAQLLGEMLAAVSLLSSTLKFEGRLSLQARGEGAISMLMVECTHQRNLRGIARWSGEVDGAQSLSGLLCQGHLVMTIEPEHGQRYQGVVPLEGDSLAACLEIYFERSEQLATRIILAADGQRSCGLLLQALPAARTTQTEEDWSRLTYLADTLTAEELLSLSNETLLTRLYHEEQVRLFDAEPLRFSCDCSRQRSARALQTLGRAELDAYLGQQPTIHIDCQFCNQRYSFDAADVAAMFAGAAPQDENPTRH